MPGPADGSLPPVHQGAAEEEPEVPVRTVFITQVKDHILPVQIEPPQGNPESVPLNQRFSGILSGTVRLPTGFRQPGGGQHVGFRTEGGQRDVRLQNAWHLISRHVRAVRVFKHGEPETDLPQRHVRNQRTDLVVSQGQAGGAGLPRSQGPESRINQPSGSLGRIRGRAAGGSVEPHVADHEDHVPGGGVPQRNVEQDAGLVPAGGGKLEQPALHLKGSLLRRHGFIRNAQGERVLLCAASVKGHHSGHVPVTLGVGDFKGRVQRFRPQQAAPAENEAEVRAFGGVNGLHVGIRVGILSPLIEGQRFSPGVRRRNAVLVPEYDSGVPAQIHAGPGGPGLRHFVEDQIVLQAEPVSLIRNVLRPERDVLRSVVFVKGPEGKKIRALLRNAVGQGSGQGSETGYIHRLQMKPVVGRQQAGAFLFRFLRTVDQAVGLVGVVVKIPRQNHQPGAGQVFRLLRGQLRGDPGGPAVRVGPGGNPVHPVPPRQSVPRHDAAVEIHITRVFPAETQRRIGVAPRAAEFVPVPPGMIDRHAAAPRQRGTLVNDGPPNRFGHPRRFLRTPGGVAFHQGDQIHQIISALSGFDLRGSSESRGVKPEPGYVREGVRGQSAGEIGEKAVDQA